MTTSGTVSPSVESSRKQESPLSGIRAIELGAFQQAPLAARWLAEAGAEVIKIEGLPGGDPTRGVQTMVGRGRPADSHNWIHEYLNRNKKSVGLYLDNERAREVVYKLVRNSDVFVTNLREPTLEKWGVTFEALAEVNPRLIYARGTGLGTTGAEAGKPALDMIGQARSGLLSVVGDLESFSMKGGLSPCDKVSSLQLAFAVSLALVARERTGRGQKVDASLLGAGIYLLAHEMQYFTGTGTQTAVVNRKGVANPLRNTYQAKDGKWMVFNMTQGDRYWHEFCRALEIEHLEHDPKYESMAARADNRAEVIALLEKVFASKPRAEWKGRLSKYNLIWSVINSIPEATEDPQVLENGYLVDGAHQQAGVVKTIGPLIGMSDTPFDIGIPAPELGQHTEEVLCEVCGYTWDDLARLKEDGVII